MAGRYRKQHYISLFILNWGCIASGTLLVSALMDAALLAMISALLAAVLASVFDQRREGAKTREAIGLLSTQVAGLTATSAAHGQQLADLKKDHRTTQEQLGQINSGLGHARERLAHIEGYLAMRTETPEEVDTGT